MRQTTPALPLLSTAVTVLPTALVTAKYWCGLAMRFTRPSAPSWNAVNERCSCRKRSWLNNPKSATSRPVEYSSVASPNATGLPSSSTFHGEKWCSGVNGVPYLARMPSDATVQTANRKAIGNSRRYVCSWECAAATSACWLPAFLSSMTLTGMPLQ